MESGFGFLPGWLSIYTWTQSLSVMVWPNLFKEFIFNLTLGNLKASKGKSLCRINDVLWLLKNELASVFITSIMLVILEVGRCWNWTSSVLLCSSCSFIGVLILKSVYSKKKKKKEWHFWNLDCFSCFGPSSIELLLLWLAKAFDHLRGCGSYRLTTKI